MYVYSYYPYFLHHNLGYFCSWDVLNEIRMRERMLHLGSMPRPKAKVKARDGSCIMRFDVAPPTSDQLVLRQTIQNAMQQTFGLTRAFTYFDFIEDDAEPSVLALKMSNACVCLLLSLPCVSWHIHRDSPFFAAALAAFAGSRTFAFRSQEKFAEEEVEEWFRAVPND